VVSPAPCFASPFVVIDGMLVSAGLTEIR
jgi:hypothetical protein